MMKSSLFSSLLLLAFTSCMVDAGLPWSKNAKLPKTGLDLGQVKPSSQPAVAATGTFADMAPEMLGSHGSQDLNFLSVLKDATSPENLSAVMGSAALAGGLAFAVAPGMGLRALGMNELEEGSAGRMFCQVLGSVDVGAAITVAALASDTPIARAVGLGLVPRLLMGLKLFATGQIEDIGYTKTGRILTKLVIGSAVATSLISGCGNTNTIMKVLAGVEVLGGLLASTKPSKLLKSTALDIDVPENSQSKAALRLLGQEIVGHGVYVGCLASGLAPAKALGWYAAIGTAEMAATAISKEYFYGDLGLSKNSIAAIGAVFGGIAVRLLSGGELE